MSAGWRDGLHQALGINTGSSPGAGLAAGSWRGRIVSVGGDLEAEAGIRFGLVVTDPAYSKHRRYQLIVPLLDLAEFEPADGDVMITNSEWVRHLDGMHEAFLAVPFIQSVFHPTEILADTGVVIDDGTLAEVEDALLQLFGL